MFLTTQGYLYRISKKYPQIRNVHNTLCCFVNPDSETNETFDYGIHNPRSWNPESTEVESKI